MKTQKHTYRYPGSRPFLQEDEDIFFGRETDIDELAKYILVEKLVVLYGRSGLGKTSLLQAGVFPKLIQQENYHIYPIRFNSYNNTTSKEPLEIVFDHLKWHLKENSFLSKIIEPKEASLWQICKHLEWEKGIGSKHILVFDQVEELFTHPEGIEEFAMQLSNVLRRRIPRKFRRKLRWRLRHEPELLMEEELLALDHSPNVKVVFSVRSDKLNLLDRLAEIIPNILENLYELRALSRNQAKRAIIEPAQKIEDCFQSPPFQYQEEALDIFLDFLTQNDKKAIESFQLQILLQYIEENIVIKANDTFIEKADVGDLKDIYQNYYDTQIQKLDSKEDIKKARVLIEEKLIFEEEQRRLSLYEGQILKQHDISPELLQKLVNTHLLRAETSGTDVDSLMYEISHDSLVEPILKAKSQRLADETIDAERRETAEMRLKVRKQKHRFRWYLANLSVIAVIGVGIVWFFYWQKKIAYEDLENQKVELESNEKKLQEQKKNLEENQDKLQEQKNRFEKSGREYERLYKIAQERERIAQEAKEKLEKVLEEKEALLIENEVLVNEVKRERELNDKRERLKNALKLEVE